MLGLALLCALAAGGERTPPPGSDTAEAVQAIRSASVPIIDGVIGEDEWRSAAALELRYQVQPGDNAAPSEATLVRVAYDADNLYIAVHAMDGEPTSVRARVGRRDEVFSDDYVMLHLDTYDDRRRAYVFWFNPLGIQADGLYNEGTAVGRNWDANVDRTWDGVLVSKGRVHERGYSIEAAIPFKTLRFQVGPSQQWGLHVQRWIARKAEQTSWRPISRDVSSLLVQMGTLGGLANLEAPRAIDLIPSVIASWSGIRQDGVLVDRRDLDPGFTGSWAITPNATLLGTLNPDFSQVEADVPQIDVNQRFPLNYPEKRPFFLEGASFLRSPGALNFLNTRNIVDPDWGVKLTGKSGRNTIAGLVASDAAPGRAAVASSPSHKEPSYVGLVRYQRDVGRNSIVGGFVTTNRFGSASNLVVAADGNIRFKGSQVIGFQTAQAATTTIDGQDLSGGATYVWYEFQGRHWRVFANDQYISPGYRNHAAFVRRTGFRMNSANIGYEFQPAAKSWWVRIRPFVVPKYLKTSTGLVDESFVDPGVDIMLARDIKLYLYHSFHQDAFGGREFPYQFDVADLTFNAFKKIAMVWRVQAGEAVNFDPAHAVVGDSLDMNLTLTLKPIEPLHQQVLVLTSRLRDKISNARLFQQEIYRSLTNYQFTRDHAARVILEYNTRSSRLSASYLYSFTPRANTAVYVGYGDVRSESAGAHDGATADRWAPLQRTAFVKVSYGFRP